MFEYEKEKYKLGYKYIIGVDEVGRGSLAGPVVACVVVINLEKLFKEELFWFNEIKDSKKISPKKRIELVTYIKSFSTKNYLGESSAQEIDELNIHQATFLAMRRAMSEVQNNKSLVVIDGRHIIPDLEFEQEAVIKADDKIFAVSCASILAKVYRDMFVIKISEQYPNYLWEKNKCYGTANHIIAIKKYGLTIYHRKSFCDHLV